MKMIIKKETARISASSTVSFSCFIDVLKMFKTLQEKGYDDLGTQALIKYYQDS